MRNVNTALSVIMAAFSITTTSVALSLSDVKPDYWKATASVPAPKGGSALEVFAYTQMSKLTQGVYNQWMSEAKTDLKQQKPRFPHELSLTTTYGICSSRLVSGLRLLTSEFGGAHPTAAYAAYSYGMLKGKPKQLVLRDVLIPGMTPDTVAVELVLPALNQMKVVRGGQAVSLLTASQMNSILVTKTGITWVFGPYEVGPWVEGAYFVKIPWSKLKGYLNPNGPVGFMLK